MRCLCAPNFKCSVCQEKVNTYGEIFEKAAAFISRLDGDELTDFLREVHMHSPNIEKMFEIKIAAQNVIEGLADIQE